MKRPDISPARSAQSALQNAQSEASNLKQQIAGYHKEREKLVDAGFDDDLTLDRLSQIEGRVSLAASRLIRANERAIFAEEQLSEITYDLGEALTAWIAEREQQTFDEFCKATSRFFDGGLNSRAFNGDSQVMAKNCWARKTWPDTDTCKRSLQRRINLASCTRQHSGKTPLGRFAALERAFAELD